MWEKTEMLPSNQELVAVLSSCYSKDELDRFVEYMKNHFSSSGGFIYICPGYVRAECLSFIENDLEDSIKKYLDMRRLIFINRDEYLTDKGLAFDRLVIDLERAINKIKEIEDERKIIVYITVDKYWNKIDTPSLSKLKKLNEEENIRFVLRYYIEEIHKNIIKQILESHDLILLDGVDTFEPLKPEELVHKALLSLCQNKVIEFKHNKAMMRNEFLENISEIIGGVVHDINNLLVSIIGYAQYSSDIDDLDEIKKCLELITKLAFDGRKVTEKIKQEMKGDKHHARDIYKFDYIVSNSIDMIKHRFSSSSNLGKATSLQLVVELKSNNYIYADEYDLRHSIINIMLNGIEAMEHGGIMTVRTYDEGDKITLEISDTGEGIEQDLLDKIFTPYFTTKGWKGTGLGLSIAKRVFEEHNGTLKVESKIGEGTKFTITFPAVGTIGEFDYDNEDNHNLMQGTTTSK